MKKIDTFSSNSLKVLERDIEEFINKYVYNLTIYKPDDRALLGQKYHNLICQKLKGFNISKMIMELTNPQKESFEKFSNVVLNNPSNFIQSEFPFLIKDELRTSPYFLTGRMDAIYFENDYYTIYDWKTLNLPNDIENDLQTIVYLYCASKIFKTQKIKMKYCSIEKLEFREIEFNSQEEYKARIDRIIGKYYDCFNSFL